MLRKLKALAAVAGGVLTLSLAACSGPAPVACSAIGYVPGFTVQLTGEKLAMPALQVCTGGDCSPTPINTPGGTVNQGKIHVFKQQNGSFSITFMEAKLPAKATVRVFDGQHFMSQKAVNLKWVPRTEHGCAAGWNPIVVNYRVVD